MVKRFHMIIIILCFCLHNSYPFYRRAFSIFVFRSLAHSLASLYLIIIFPVLTPCLQTHKPHASKRNSKTPIWFARMTFNHHSFVQVCSKAIRMVCVWVFVCFCWYFLSNEIGIKIKIERPAWETTVNLISFSNNCDALHGENIQRQRSMYDGNI